MARNRGPSVSPWATDGASLRALAEATARDTGMWVAAQRRHGVGGTSTKSTATDLVTLLDRGAETRIVERLRRSRPHDAIVGEEGANELGSTGIQWLIDPIDGTTNLVYDLGGYAISIGALDAQGAIAGAVYVPSSGELFSAHRGGGATCDGVAISPSSTRELGQALVGTGFSYDADRRRLQAHRIAMVLPHIRDLRRFGAAAVDLCLVACGRLDVYFEQHLNSWDTAAGALIAAEAGCDVGNFAGGPARHDEVLACAPALFEAMVALLHATTPPVA